MLQDVLVLVHFHGPLAIIMFPGLDTGRGKLRGFKLAIVLTQFTSETG